MVRTSRSEKSGAAELVVRAKTFHQVIAGLDPAIHDEI